MDPEPPTTHTCVASAPAIANGPSVSPVVGAEVHAVPSHVSTLPPQSMAHARVGLAAQIPEIGHAAGVTWEVQCAPSHCQMSDAADVTHTWLTSSANTRWPVPPSASAARCQCPEL